MHSECDNLFELCKKDFVYINDNKGDLVALKDLNSLGSASNVFIQIADDKGLAYRISMKYCLDCGKKLLNEFK